MQLLNYKKLGEKGESVFILHGLFGSLDNWQTIGKQLSEKYTVYLVDQRNHGHSFHANECTYESMANDLHNLSEQIGCAKASIIGHSMGGKTAMVFAREYPQLIEKLIVVDIAPRYYAPHHTTIIDTLSGVDFSVVKTRKEVEAALQARITEQSTIQFLLKNLYWKDGDSNELAWRFNLPVLREQIEQIGKKIDMGYCSIPTLFLRGEHSKYISDSDFADIQNSFVNAELQTIPNAGHWIHAEQPQLFLEHLLNFLR
ncbi:MAG: alpha/beta fold hydrolase [Bacteroidetes bacterium]|nr:alpha/beta fold hydrolase [Bacteroidota bacterium]